MYLFSGDIDHTRGRPRYQQFVTNLERGGLNSELRHTELGEILRALAHIHLTFGGTRAIFLVPLTHELTLVVAIPEATVEDTRQTLVPLVFLLLGKGAVEHALDSLLVALHHGIDILRTAGPTLDLEHPHTRFHHTIDKTHGLEILRTHQIFIVHLYLMTRFGIGEDIRTTAYLYALAAVGRPVGSIQTHVALTRDGHAESTMTEHLDADRLTRRSADALLHRLTMNLCHLVHIQLTRQYHHIGKLGIETQGLDVGDIQLRTQMHLLSHRSAIGHHRHIRGDDSRDARLLGRIHNLVHQRDILVVDDGIHREVRLDAVLITRFGNLLQIGNSEGAGRMCPHIQLLNTEIDRVGTRLNGSRKTLPGAYGGHNLKITQLLFHQMLRYDTGNGVLIAFHAREEGLGSAETQEHIQAYGDMVTVVSDIETHNLLVLSLLQFHIREFQTAVFLTVISLDGRLTAIAQLGGINAIAVGNGNLHHMTLGPAFGVEATCPEEDVQHVVHAILPTVVNGLTGAILILSALGEMGVTTFVVIPHLIHRIAFAFACSLTEIEGSHVETAVA